ncbi:MAG: GNAT family N-acetyltransferase [Pseudomonadales bacterium]|nr:GNAT family N-acetyltransferase [Pseudomonadales bacterium]NRA16275.1 GNAT family N-acetyltransferase [Oceanospirillaceae bacterium]
MHYRNIEQAAFQAWPAKEQSGTETVVMRCSDGYTKRANSATVLTASSSEHESLQRSCEQFFGDRNLPCIIRLTSRSQAQSLDQHLAERGYLFKDRSLILDMAMSAQQPMIPPALDTQADSGLVFQQPRQWLQTFCDLSGMQFQEHLAHLAILERIDQQMILAQWQVQGRAVACAVGVLSNGYFGVFDLVTAPNARHRGYATNLLNSMLEWAVDQGATHSYLQVVAVNDAAIKLYQKFGFSQSYEYWYRIKAK